MEARRRTLALLAVAVLVTAGGCTTSDRPISGRVARPVPWERVSLAADTRGAAEVRAVGHCAAGWYAAGAAVSASGQNQPALWFSSDAMTWSLVTIKPVSVYGPANILYSVACNESQVVAVGAAVGGAHGNPRTSTWYGKVGGTTLTEAHATFETYGGPDAVGVGSVSAGSAGFLIVGGRVDANNALGAAVWRSSNGATFRLIDADPALESGPSGATEAHGGLAGGAIWITVGGITPPASSAAARDAAVWLSSDGVTWRRAMLPTSAADDILEQVTPTSSGLLAIGTDGTGYSAWVASANGASWRRAGHFGDHRAATAAPRTVGVAVSGRSAYATVYNGSSYELWRGSTGGTNWERVALPPGAASITGIVGSGRSTLISATMAGGSSQLYLGSG